MCSSFSEEAYNNPAVCCATESWLWPSETDIARYVWANTERQQHQTRLASDAIRHLEMAQNSDKCLCFLFLETGTDRSAGVGCKLSRAFAHTVSYTHTMRNFQVLEANLGTASENHQDSGARSREAKKWQPWKQMERSSTASRQELQRKHCKFHTYSKTGMFTKCNF